MRKPLSLLYIGIGLMVAGVVTLVIGERLNTVNGLLLTHNETVRVPWLYSEGNAVDIFEPTTFRYEGYLEVPRAGDYVVELASGGAAEVTLNGEQVLQTAQDDSITTQQATVTLPAGLVPITATTTHDPDAEGRPFFYVTWDHGLLKQQRIPEHRLFVEETGSSYRAVRVIGWALISAGGLASAAGIGLAVRSGDLPLRRLVMLIGLAVLAFGLRAAFITEWSSADPRFYELPRGSDHRRFEIQARGLDTDTWPVTGYYHQPGQPYTNYVIDRLVGPLIVADRLFVAGLSSLGVLFIFGTTFRLFNDERAALIAGVMAAVFPVSIFYTGTGLITVTAITLAAFVLWQLSIVVTEPPAWGNLILAAMGLAVLTIHRQNFMLVLPVVLVWMYFSRVIPRKQFVAMAAVFTAVAAFTFWPVPHHNYSVGDNYLSTPIGAQSWYQGNNRDSTGFYSNPQAWVGARLAGQDYWEAFFADVQAEPVRWVELLMHKTAKFWDGVEVSANVSYAGDGLAHSVLLRVLRPYTFSVIALVGLVGIVLSVVEGRREVHLLTVFIVITMMAAVGFTPESRIRIPVIAALLPLGGYALSEAITAVRQRALPRLRTLGRITGGVALVLVALAFIHDSFPRPRLTARPPDTMIPMDVVFDDKIRLVGYELKRSDTTIENRKPYFITLYWQRMQPLEEDYAVFLHVIEPGADRIAEFEYPIGLVSYQFYTTSEWRNDRIFEEEYMIVPQETTRAPEYGQVWVGVIDPESRERLPYTEAGDTTVVVTTMRVDPPNYNPTTENTPVVRVGDWATLTQAEVEQPSPTSLQVNLEWSAGGPAPRDYRMFVHVVDDTGSIVAQRDTSPIEGRIPLTLWHDGDVFREQVEIPLPDALDMEAHRVVWGLYDVETGMRVPLTTPDGQPLPDNAYPLE